MFQIKPTLLGTLAYTLVTFCIAILWHIVLFEQHYQDFGYIEGEPNFLLGFITIVIQGFILSALYPLVQLKSQGIARGLKYSLTLGVFFWTSHVLAFIAKQEISNSSLFLIMESLYLCIQFGVYGVLIGLICKQNNKE